MSVSAGHSKYVSVFWSEKVCFMAKVSVSVFWIEKGVTMYRHVWCMCVLDKGNHSEQICMVYVFLIGGTCVWGREGSHCVQACMVYRCFCVEGSGIVQTCMVYAFA